MQALLAFLLQAPAPLFIPMVRTCWHSTMVSPGCFCPGSGNDPLKKQLVQHLEKEEQVSIGNKIQERNSFTSLTCQEPAQIPVHVPLHHRRPQLNSLATLGSTGGAQ